MPSAWLTTPLGVYEKHVELESVGQAAAIREILAGAVVKHRPSSLLYLGCAGGNGLESVSGLRVIGLDLNPEYVAAASARFPRAEFHVCDLNGEFPAFEPVEMAFGALVFEYLIDPGMALQRVTERLAAGGRLIAPLLQAAGGVPAVLPSPYIEQLSPLGEEYRTVEPEPFMAEAARAGFILEARFERPLPSGKRFVVLDLRRT